MPNVTIGAKYPEPVEVQTPGAKVILGLDVLPEDSRQGGFSMSSMGRVTIIPDEPATFDSLLERLGRVTRLLTMMAGSPVSTDCISVTPDDTTENASVLIALRNREVCTFSNELEFFLLERTLGVSIADVLSRWFECIESVDLPSRLAVDVLNDSGNGHLDFLAVMQALEGFHRGRHGGFYMDPGKFEEARSIVTNCVPASITGDHRASFLKRVEHGNEYSLRRRMKELVRSLPSDMQRRVVGNEGDIPGFWVDARNAYTHWFREGFEELHGTELYGAIQRLKMLLRVCYLRMVGVPDGSITAALQGTSDTSRCLRFLPRPCAPKAKVVPPRTDASNS